MASQVPTLKLRECCLSILQGLSIFSISGVLPPCVMLCQEACLRFMWTGAARHKGRLLLHSCPLLERLRAAAGWAMWTLSSWQTACSTLLPTWAS